MPKIPSLESPDQFACMDLPKLMLVQNFASSYGKAGFTVNVLKLDRGGNLEVRMSPKKLDDSKGAK